MEHIALNFGALLEYWQWLQQLDHSTLLMLCAAAAIPLWFLIFIIKTLMIWLLRKLGCSSPKLYASIPTLPWRTVMRVNMRVSAWLEQFKFSKLSTGGFASVAATLTHRHSARTLFLGLAWCYGFGIVQSVGLPMEKHALIVAGTGSGKTSTVSTMLSEWEGSAFVLDPTSAIYQAIAAHDKKRQYVHLAPYEEDTAQLNPFDDVKAAIAREGEQAAVKWANRLGNSFIITVSGEKQPYFTDTSRGMFVSIVLFVLSQYPEEEQHLGTVRDLIVHGMRVFNEDGTLESTPEESHQLLHKMLRESSAFKGAISGGAAAFINASKDTRANLDSTLLNQTKILDIPSVRYFFSSTTRPLSELKTQNDVVFVLDVPLYSLREELQGVARVVQNLVCYTFESVKKKNGNCLFVVDEVQAQGYNQTLEISLNVARSQGLFVLAITQDLEGLKAAYPKTYLSFIGNAEFVIWMGTAHPDNLAMLSRLLGKKTIVETDKHTGRKSYREVDVMKAEQLGRFLNPKRGNMIVTRAGRALRLKIDPYFKSLPVWRYSPDPNHKEKLFRRMMRALLNQDNSPSKEKRHESL